MPRKFFMTLAFSVGLLLGTASSAFSHLLTVDLRTDYRAGDEFIAARTSLSHRTLTNASRIFPVFTGDPVESGHRIADIDGVSEGVYDLLVELLRADGSVLGSRRSSLTMDGNHTVVALIERTSEAAPTCEEQLASTQAELATVRESLPDTSLATRSAAATRMVAASLRSDADGDRVMALTDKCPNTPAGRAVDGTGCSNDEFCRSIPVATATDQQRCRRADWRGDEAGVVQPMDCNVRGSTCVAK